MNGLGNEQAEHFQKNGYLLVERMFDDGEVAAMRREADGLLELLVNSSLANGRTSTRLDLRELPAGGQVVRKIQPVVDLSPLFDRLAKDERLVGVLRRLQGDEPELMEDKFSYKQRLAEPVRGLETRKADDRFLMHNDYAYHVGHGYPPTIVTCGIALDDCTEEKGPFHVWPGSHSRHIEHEPVGERSHQVPADRLDPRGGIDVIARAGSAILFSDLLVHNSRPNVSAEPRRILFFSYCPRGSMPDADVRNRPVRRSETDWEQRYRALKAEGIYRDSFRAPREAGV
jgi:Phytanoyl-CoA dioxygenase (PhyH)